MKNLSFMVEKYALNFDHLFILKWIKKKEMTEIYFITEYNWLIELCHYTNYEGKKLMGLHEKLDTSPKKKKKVKL